MNLRIAFGRRAPNSEATRFVPWQTVTNLLERIPLSLIFLAGGISVASVFFRSGMLKVESWDVAVQLFRDEYRVRVGLKGPRRRLPPDTRLMPPYPARRIWHAALDTEAKAVDVASGEYEVVLYRARSDLAMRQLSSAAFQFLNFAVPPWRGVGDTPRHHVRASA